MDIVRLWNIQEGVKMNFTKKERLEIGRQIYENEISKQQATLKYNITLDAARSYMRYYRDENHLPPKEPSQGPNLSSKRIKPPADLEDYENMTKDELIGELITARVNEARLKKGYLVKGVGAEKEFILLSSKNTK